MTAEESRFKKEFIIKSYLDNPSMNFQDFATENMIHYSHVKRTVNNLKRQLSVIYPIYCEKSLDLPNVYYIFTQGEEKKITVKNNIIQNKVLLTDYEKLWLMINKRITIEQ